jgi:hypothetical protein
MQVKSNPTPLLFLSHAGADTEAASQLKRRIEETPSARESGLKVWFDKDDLQAGQDWQAQLEDVIEKRATAFAVYVGSSGVINWVEREVRLGLSRATVSDESVGDVLVAQGNLPQALQSYRDGLAIRARLAKADPGNAGWQRDLFISDNNIGNVLVTQGNLPEALQYYRDGLAIVDLWPRPTRAMRCGKATSLSVSSSWETLVMIRALVTRARLQLRNNSTPRENSPPAKNPGLATSKDASPNCRNLHHLERTSISMLEFHS